MLNTIRKFFSSTQSLKFQPVDEGWFLLWVKSKPKDEIDAFTWASELPDYQMGQALYLAQLVTEGMASLTDKGLLIPWSNLYKILSDTEHSGLIDSLELPKIINSITPIIDSKKSLSDRNFEIILSGWKQGNNFLKETKLNGAILSWNNHTSLIPETSWHLLNAIQQFSSRNDSQKSQNAQEMLWGKLRVLATKANASYASRYLEGTIIVTPETLNLDLEHIENGDETVVQVTPRFNDAPDNWLKHFDFHSNIQDKYSFSTAEGLTQVILSKPVKRVLSVIKRDMPQRKVIGKKAEAFLRNPYALLGDDTHSVIDEDYFFKEKEKLGSLQNDWRLEGVFHKGIILSVDLIIEKESRLLSDKFQFPQELSDFLKSLEYTIENQELSYHWKDYYLSLEHKACNELAQGKRILNAWEAQKTNLIGFEEIYDLSLYGDRIVAIGESKSVVLPILLKPSGNEADWSPEMQPAILVNLPDSQEPLLIPATKGFLRELERNITSSKEKKSTDIDLPVLHFPIKTTEAEHIFSVLNDWLASPPPPPPSDDVPTSPKKKPQTLIIGTNFNELDYIEQRKQRLAVPKQFKLSIPKSLRKEIVLKDHQKEGLRWLQFLSNLKEGCHGALLADDMGLGKTLQLLCLLAEHYQKNPDSFPSMIVAPVTLLDNWEQEIEKFFSPSFPQVMRLHGNRLKQLKQPRELIESQLLDEGISSLLQTKWLGNAKLVITTYETVRDYEFSLARQDFEFLICDEAQKIKNPKSMATLAIKKQKARFKIACTGTPVENNLVDLWCLFDWIQPSLLGTIQEFHSQYRRPIEVRTEQEEESLKKLRNLIEPQVLRRMKTDISEDLPKKCEKYNRKILVEGEGQELSILGIDMVKYQEDLYQDTITRLSKNSENPNAKDRVKNTWSLLHKIKAICAEPYCLPGLIFKPISPVSKHLDNSPKLKWLLTELKNIKKKEEKAIIFTELRQVQNALGYFLKQEFNIIPHVVNGQTKNRQNLIDIFQEKKGFNAIILSPLAAGAGLNIVGANHVIHFTRTWNPAKESQATDRAYRIGQKKDVWVYCPTVISPTFVTFEQKLDLLMRRKSGLADDMLNGIGGNFTSRDFVESDTDRVGSASYLTIENIDQLDGDDFEIFCQKLLQKEGWSVELTEKKGGDGGIDLVALSKDKGLLVQCKKSGVANKQLGWDAIKEVVGGAARYEKDYTNVSFKKMVITNQYFNSRAKEQAKINAVDVWERAEIQKRLSEFHIEISKFDDFISTSTTVRYQLDEISS